MLNRSKSAPAILKDHRPEAETESKFGGVIKLDKASDKTLAALHILNFLTYLNKYEVSKTPPAADYNPCAVVPGCVPLNRHW